MSSFIYAYVTLSFYFYLKHDDFDDEECKSTKSDIIFISESTEFALHSIV